MRATTDTVKGRIKQTLGALTGNKKLKRDGRADERTGRIKKQADGAIDAVRDTLEDAAETLRPGPKEK
jgi:uncharacterized protein YjbJ (UPF0337 family)